MKKTLRFALMTALVLTLMICLGTAALADDAPKDELPTEYVSYGYGLSTEDSVDRHELEDEDITIEGVAWKTRTSDERLYVRLTDLVAAKLLREGKEKAEELGIDYAKLYIEMGKIEIADSVSEDEAEELRAKLDELTGSVWLAMHEGDTFEVGNGGEGKLLVRIAGFVAEPEEDTGLDVVGIDDHYYQDADYARLVPSAETISSLKKTTVYLAYYGMSIYDYEAGGDVAIISVPEQHCYGDVGIAKSKEDTTPCYYIKVDYGETATDYTPVKDLAEITEEAWKSQEYYDYYVPFAETEYTEDSCKAVTAEKILVSSDGSDDGVVMTITLTDKTPAPEDLAYEENLCPIYDNDTGYIDVDGYEKSEEYFEKHKYNGYTVPRDCCDYTAEETVTVEEKTADTATVSLQNDIHLAANVG